MGTWGTGIFQSDYALDVKDTYMDRIRKGEDDESVMNSLIAEYEREGDFNYDDTRYVFWLALAYIQWKTGRLDPMVKERALSCIQDGSELELWKGETETTYRHRKKALADLEEALLSPQRKRTVYRQPKDYYCGWEIGDVYALKISEEMQPLFDSKAQYLLIRTVDTDKWQPWQTVPIVHVKLSNGDALPKNVKEYDECEYIQIGFTHYENRFYPLEGGNDKELIAERSKVKCEVNEYGVLPEYRVKLLSTCKRVIPKSLIYVGNFADAVPPKQEFVPFSKINIRTERWGENGRSFENIMQQLYHAHNLHELEVYSNPEILKKGVLPIELFMKFMEICEKPRL